MRVPNLALLALFATLLSPAAPALAQNDRPPPTVDLKPLLPIIPQPLLPPNSVITPGSVHDPSPYSGGPLFDPTQNQATPGFRLTIPTR